jgi:truncated hemoglobin YjbI
MDVIRNTKEEHLDDWSRGECKRLLKQAWAGMSVGEVEKYLGERPAASLAYQKLHQAINDDWVDRYLLAVALAEWLWKEERSPITFSDYEAALYYVVSLFEVGWELRQKHQCSF